MANRRRGDVDAILGGQRYTLRLTLGALAELEDAFGAGDLVDLAQRFEGGRLGARDLLHIIAAGLRGGGTPISDAEAATLASENGLADYVRIAADLLAATFGDGEGAGGSPRPRAPQEA